MAKNTNDSTRTLSPAVMALVGGVVGAGMALFLSDEKRRQKIVDMFSEFKATSEEVGATIYERGMEVKDSLAGEVEETTDRVRRASRTAVDGVRSLARDTVEEVRDTADETTEELRKTKDKVQDDAQKVAQRTKKDVEEKANNGGGRGR